MPWPCNPDEKWIVHFPETREIWSFGSGYGGNALLGKKCFALRIASVIARDEGWLAEHMLVLKITSPEGTRAATSPPRSRRRAARPTSPCSSPPIPGWTVETIGDDIAWMKFGADGRLHAINPEFGFFGVAPGTNETSNPNAIHTLDTQHRVHQHRAHRRRRRVVGRHDRRAARAPHRLAGQRRGRPAPTAPPRTRTPGSASRRRSARRSRPSGRTRRRADLGVPLRRPPRHHGAARVRVARLAHGVLVAATMGSEKTAAAAGGLGELRRDPFAMLPFCGYNMGDYFAHWLSMTERTDEAKLPAHLRRELVPQGRRRQVPVAGLRRELARARVDLPSARGRRRGAPTPPSAWCPTVDDLDLDGLDAPRGDVDAALASTPTSGAPSCPASARYFDELRRAPPASSRAARRARAAPRRRLEHAPYDRPRRSSRREGCS